MDDDIADDNYIAPLTPSSDLTTPSSDEPAPTFRPAPSFRPRTVRKRSAETNDNLSEILKTLERPKQDEFDVFGANLAG